MEDLEKENPKHNVARDSNNGPSPMVHDNAGEDIAKNNNETSTNDNPTPSLNVTERKVILSRRDLMLNPMRKDVQKLSLIHI